MNFVPIYTYLNLIYSAARKARKEAFFLRACFKERMTLYGERNNTRYDTRSKVKRETEGALAW